jgi:hypothetical protein
LENLGIRHNYIFGKDIDGLKDNLLLTTTSVNLGWGK